MDAIRIPGVRLAAPRLALLCGVAAFAASAWLSASADTEVYKWVDPQGRIHYSDRPPPSEGKLLSMEAAASARPHVAAPSPSAVATPPAPRSAATPATLPPTPGEIRQKVEADVATAHAEQCKTAQDRYQKYVNSRHLYREGPNQERVYLTDAELETERLNAKREADEACSNSG
jgi:hypothetical protein